MSTLTTAICYFQNQIIIILDLFKSYKTKEQSIYSGTTNNFKWNNWLQTHKRWRNLNWMIKGNNHPDLLYCISIRKHIHLLSWICDLVKVTVQDMSETEHIRWKPGECYKQPHGQTTRHIILVDPVFLVVYLENKPRIC